MQLQLNQQSKKVAEIILNRIRQQLEKRGTQTIRSLGRVFRQIDSFDGNRKIDAQEFSIGMKELGVQLTRDEENLLIQYLDKNKDRVIDYDEFLIGIRGTLNPIRSNIVQRAFQKLDRNRNGYIDIEDVQALYNVKAHPKYQSGEMSQKQILDQFLSNFGDIDKDGKIQYQEWLDYYSAVSSSIDNDSHFVELMRIAWKLDY